MSKLYNPFSGEYSEDVDAPEFSELVKMTKRNYMTVMRHAVNEIRTTSTRLNCIGRMKGSSFGDDAQMSVYNLCYKYLFKFVNIPHRNMQDLSDVVKKGIELSKQSEKIAVINFNGIILLMDKNTDPKKLMRDYDNSSTMGWKILGPSCNEYPKKLQLEIKNRIKKRVNLEMEITTYQHKVDELFRNGKGEKVKQLLKYL